MITLKNNTPWIQWDHQNQLWLDGPLLQKFFLKVEGGLLECGTLRNASVEPQGEAIIISGRLGPKNAELTLERRWENLGGRWREHIRLTNPGSNSIRISSALVGVQPLVSESHGPIKPDHAEDRFVALPFRRMPWSTEQQDWSAADLARYPGKQRRVNEEQVPGWLPGWQHLTEGVAWERPLPGGPQSLLVLTVNDDLHQFGAVAGLSCEEGFRIGLGAALPGSGQPGRLETLEPGATLDMGFVYYEIVAGAHSAAMLAARSILDSHGFRFPADFNPPLHWNELYDNPEWLVWTPQPITWCAHDHTREKTYTRESMEAEAAKAAAYGCESLYLDPGWDDCFASFRWDEARLGPLREFVRHMRETYNLGVSLHCPLAPWMSRHSEKAANSYPVSTRLQRADGETGQIICIASPEYLDEAERRLLALCEAGVTFLMFDGNFWIGPCYDPKHGHEVPMSFDDHLAASIELARRVKRRFPDVLIEMHDPIAGGARPRWAPVYFGYNPRKTFDTNWGFELMWHCFEDLESGRALALYEYNLTCNVPLYLHIDLRDDNEHTLLFWWYASTCRHLGIGGTHPNINIAAQHRAAGMRYRELARFYKRGEFYGISEEIHLHVLKEENAVVINVFNLSHQRKTVSGRVTFGALGLDPKLWYQREVAWVNIDGWQTTPDGTGFLIVTADLPPWGHRMQVVRPV